jgi:hypothetical protein
MQIHEDIPIAAQRIAAAALHADYAAKKRAALSPIV